MAVKRFFLLRETDLLNEATPMNHKSFSMIDKAAGNNTKTPPTWNEPQAVKLQYYVVKAAPGCRNFFRQQNQHKGPREFSKKRRKRNSYNGRILNLYKCGYCSRKSFSEKPGFHYHLNTRTTSSTTELDTPTA